MDFRLFSPQLGPFYSEEMNQMILINNKNSYKKG